MSASMEEQFDSWFAKKVAGVAAALCVTAEEAEGMLLAAFQDLQVNNNCADGGSGAVHVVVADTGATVRVIGHTDTHRAVNITDLRRPVIVQGAGGPVSVTQMGDLPGFGGLMRRCLIMPDCGPSLMPVVPVCEEMGVGFEVDHGGQSGKFSKDGRAVVELYRKGDVLVVPEHQPELLVQQSQLCCISTLTSTKTL